MMVDSLQDTTETFTWRRFQNSIADNVTSFNGAIFYNRFIPNK